MVVAVEAPTTEAVGLEVEEEQKPKTEEAVVEVPKKVVVEGGVA